MARPYPTKNAALLDSFLEHKIENERLTRRIADLKREEAEEADEGHKTWLKKQEGRSEIQSEETDTMGSTTAPLPGHVSNPDALAMPPPAKPSSMNAALTRQNLEDANAGSRPDSINDKMARYEGATHIETIEMLTGLRYQDGERSHGISTGDQSPALIRGDAGIAIPVDKEARGGDKKKKIKLPDEYVCTDCGMFICCLRSLHTLTLKVLLILPNGAKVLVDQRRYATPAAFDGPRRRKSEQVHLNRRLCSLGRPREAVRVYQVSHGVPGIRHLGKVQVGSLFNGVQEGHE